MTPLQQVFQSSIRNCYGCGDIYYCSNTAHNIMYRMYITPRCLHVWSLGKDKMIIFVLKFSKKLPVWCHGTFCYLVRILSEFHCFPTCILFLFFFVNHYWVSVHTNYVNFHINSKTKQKYSSWRKNNILNKHLYNVT